MIKALSSLPFNCCRFNCEMELDLINYTSYSLEYFTTLNKLLYDFDFKNFDSISNDRCL